MKTDLTNLQKLYSDGYSLNDLQKILGVHRSTLSGYLKESGIHVNYQEKSKNLNQNYFNQIDSEDRAYMLGFIFADGSINLDYNRLTIDLSIQDQDILVKFSTILYGRNHVKVYTRNNRKYCKLDINSKTICNQLLKYNLTENKTFTAQYPEMIDRSLNKHFIRGLIDGDGCIYLPSNNRSSPLVALIATRAMNDTVSKILDSVLNLKSYVCKVHGQDISIMSELRIKNYHRCKILLDWLYRNSSIHLDRKYNRYLTFLSRYDKLRDQNK